MKHKNETRREQISEINSLRKEVDRLSRHNRQLTDENREIRIQLAKQETQPLKDSREITMNAKRTQLENLCLYGIDHFCDGAPNRSVDVSDYLPPCPDYKYCTIRQRHIFKTKGEG